jgi:hypothetical protein
MNFSCILAQTLEESSGAASDMEQTLEAYLEEKSERRSSKKKRREIEGRMQSGGRGEGRKRRSLVGALCVRKMIVCT